MSKANKVEDRKWWSEGRMLEIEILEVVCCYWKRSKHDRRAAPAWWGKSHCRWENQIPRFQVVRPPFIQRHMVAPIMRTMMGTRGTSWIRSSGITEQEGLGVEAVNRARLEGVWLDFRVIPAETEERWQFKERETQSPLQERGQHSLCLNVVPENSSQRFGKPEEMSEIE